MIEVGSKVRYAGSQFQDLYDRETGTAAVGEVVSHADKNPNKLVVVFRGESYMLPPDCVVKLNA